MSTDQLKAHLEFFGELGVDGVRTDPAWRQRRERELPEPAEPVEPIELAEPGETLAAIRFDLGECTRCKLAGLGRKQIVFGVGNPGADLMFVGEAPGADEDIQGEPFVGRAGQLLTRIIEAIDLRREDVYIANVIKCRPPGNRNPEPEEVAKCTPHLLKQIELVQPRLIVAMGRFAAQTLLDTDAAVGSLRGRVHRYAGVPLVVTYHPAYLLRNLPDKAKAWEDLVFARKTLQAL